MVHCPTFLKITRSFWYGGPSCLLYILAFRHQIELINPNFIKCNKSFKKSRNFPRNKLPNALSHISFKLYPLCKFFPTQHIENNAVGHKSLFYLCNSNFELEFLDQSLPSSTSLDPWGFLVATSLSSHSLINK
jgi:hypothetical protein